MDGWMFYPSWQLARAHGSTCHLLTFACGSQAQVNHSPTSLPAGVIGEVFVEDGKEEVGSGRGLQVTAYNSDKPG